MKVSRAIQSAEVSFSCDDAAFPSNGPFQATRMDYQYHIAFGLNFCRARVAAKLSRRDVAARTGLSETHIRAIEAGQRDPKLKAMTALAHVVDRDVWMLLILPDGRDN